jgi:decaprenylphospho-beta-D-ribofuranose 2-oxidase
MPPLAESPQRPRMPGTARRVALKGWGGGLSSPGMLVRPASIEALREAVSGAPAPGAIARGMGRSYGDAAQRRGGLVIDMTALLGCELDPELGELTVGAGVTIRQLMAELAPAGWILPVVPGTQHVTVGGAIASDVHGKNHRSAGSFGDHVLALGLLTAEGDVIELRPDSDAELMRATVGGMGLTGVILSARIRLCRLPSPLMAVDSDRIDSLDEALALLGGRGGAHGIAWLDLLGTRQVRGVVTRAEPLDRDVSPTQAAELATVTTRFTVPSVWPGGILRPGLVRAYNDLRLRRTPRHSAGRVEPLGAHLFQLDALGSWPRLYGPQGLVQYQAVIPRSRQPTLEGLILRLRRSAVPCYLATLKELGPASEASLSFPLEGWTIALDLPRVATGLEDLMSQFDELVAGAGGRVYLTKDSRLRPDMLSAMYSRLETWRRTRERVDPEHVWCSDLGVRTGLIRADP